MRGEYGETMDYDAFFADRVSHFTDERKVFSDYMTMIKLDQSEAHNLDWQNKSLQDGIDTTKSQLLSYDKEYKRLNDDIEKVRESLIVLKENKEIRLTQIKALSELQQPVQHDTTYFVPERFFISEKQKKLESVTSRNRKDGIQYGKVVDHVTRRIPKTGEIVSLEKQITDSTSRASSSLRTISSMLKEAEDERLRHRMAKNNELEPFFQHTEILLEEVNNYEMQCYMSVSELLKLRLRILVAQREEVEEMELLDNDRQFYDAREKKTKKQLFADMAMMKTRLKEELKETTIEFLRQSRELDKQLMTARSKETTVVEQTAARLAIDGTEQKLRNHLRMVKTRYAKLVTRSKLEAEGCQSEMQLLTKKLRKLEKMYSDLTI